MYVFLCSEEPDLYEIYSLVAAVQYLKSLISGLHNTQLYSWSNTYTSDLRFEAKHENNTMDWVLSEDRLTDTSQLHMI